MTAPLAMHLSLVLARYDDLRDVGALNSAAVAGTLFAAVASDTRAAATEAAAQRAFTFMIFGVHADEHTANRFIDNRHTAAPWLSEAKEVWAATLKPYRHTGDANYLNRAQPGPMFEASGAPPDADAPIVILTTVGWKTGEGFDQNRVAEFSKGVTAVRIAMTGMPGLHSQQSFFFPGVLVDDPMTVTVWRNAAAVRAFAYGPGIHRVQMQRDTDEKMADRLSFTRCSILRSEGSWYGCDPVAAANS